MSEESLLGRIVEANKSYLEGTPRFLDPEGAPFVVLACMDPRLTGLLEPALGLPRHRAVVLRTAGNRVAEDSRDVLRSIAAALFLKGCREIFVVGHTDCAMAAFSAAEAAENFRSAGVPRTAFGDEDLRTWFGAFAGIRNNVVESIEHLRRCGIVPAGTKIHGAILDTLQGGLEIVVDGDIAPGSSAPPAVEPEAESPARQAVESAAEASPRRTVESGVEASTYPEPEIEAPPLPELEFEAAAEPVPPPPPASPRSRTTPREKPIIIPQPTPEPEKPHTAAPPASLFEAAMILKDFFRRERASAEVRQAMAQLQATWKRQRSPADIFAVMSKMALDYESRYPRVPGALAYLEHAVRSAGADRIGFADIMRRIFD